MTILKNQSRIIRGKQHALCNLCPLSVRGGLYAQRSLLRAQERLQVELREPYVGQGSNLGIPYANHAFSLLSYLSIPATYHTKTVQKSTYRAEKIVQVTCLACSQPRFNPQLHQEWFLSTDPEGSPKYCQVWLPHPAKIESMCELTHEERKRLRAYINANIKTSS